MNNRELKKAIKEKRVILFVGAGISATLGLPTWDDLVSKMGDDLGYDSDLFKQYGDNLILAEYYSIVKGRIGELRSWMDENWKISKAKIKESKIYETIAKLEFPLVYTTNYDHCLEKAFDTFNRKYKRVVDVDDLVGLDTNTTQIIKFHGDTISDESIVLTESSYFQRLVCPILT